MKLLKSPLVGSSQYGDYYLYPVEVNGEERSFFATPEIHNQISELKLGPGDTVILRKLAQQNGKKVNAKWMLEVVQKASVEPRPTNVQPESTVSDNLKELLLQCINDAAEVIKSAGIQFSNDELQKLATTLFIQRSR